MGVATMKKLARIHMGLVGLALLGFGGQALATTVCNTGPLASPPISGPALSGTVVGGVVVNASDICLINGANVSGGVQVHPGGVLIVCASTINGGVTTNGAAEVVFGAEELNCGGDIVNGTIKISNNGPGIFAPKPSIGIERSTLNGGVTLSNNQGLISVSRNTIAGGLACSNNANDLTDEGVPSIITGKVSCKFADEE
jgi:hypothetical protein